MVGGGIVEGECADIGIGRLIDVEPLGAAVAEIGGGCTAATRQRPISRDRHLDLIEILEVARREWRPLGGEELAIASDIQRVVTANRSHAVSGQVATVR